MNAAGVPDRPRRLRQCLVCGATSGVDDPSLTCPRCVSSDFEEVSAESASAEAPTGAEGSPAAEAGPALAGAGPSAAGAGDRAAASLLPPGERWLQVTFQGDGQSWQLELRPGEEVELGRDPGYSRYAPDLATDDTVSRCHAVIGLDADGSAWIRDVGSTNGTAVNDRRLPQHANRSPQGQARYPLRDGDRIRLGLGTLGKIRFVPASQD